MDDDYLNIPFWEGQQDCIDGLDPKSLESHYLRGYNEQYALEQQLTAQGEKNELS